MAPTSESIIDRAALSGMSSLRSMSWPCFTLAVTFPRIRGRNRDTITLCNSLQESEVGARVRNKVATGGERLAVSATEMEISCIEVRAGVYQRAGSKCRVPESAGNSRLYLFAYCGLNHR